MEWKGIKGTILKDVPMKRYTSMKVGGQVAYLAYPSDEADLAATLQFVKDRSVGVQISRQRNECDCKRQRFERCLDQDYEDETYTVRKDKGWRRG